jgi:hypothetical protein
VSKSQFCLSESFTINYPPCITRLTRTLQHLVNDPCHLLKWVFRSNYFM